MVVNPKLSEEMNLLLHLNEWTEFPFTLDDIRFGLPKVLVSLPPNMTAENYRSFPIDRKNTEVVIQAKSTSKRYKGTSIIKPYRRIHLGAQWHLLDRENLLEKIDGRYVVYTNTWLHETPTLEEVYSTLQRAVSFRRESLEVEVLDYQASGYNFDKGKIRIKPIRNSLLYVGNLELDVVYRPISFLPDYLPGFSGY